MKVNRLFKLIIIVILFSFINVFALDEVQVSPSSNYREETNGTYKIIIDDGANLLSDEEEIRLLDDMKNLAEFGNVGFVSASSCNNSTKQCAKDYYHDKFQFQSGTVIYVDMQNRIIGIVSEGDNKQLVTDNKATIIIDKYYQYASTGDYYSCAYYSFQDVEKVLRKEKISEPMRYVTNILLSLILGVFVSFFIILITSKNDTSKKKINKKNYNKALTINNFNAIIVGTRKVYNPPSDSDGFSGGSSSGWSSRGGGFSGGGFSGGGFSGGGHSSSGSFGGHRF